MQPESSNGFASVGTVLPSEEVALLPGGLFHFESASPVGTHSKDFGARILIVALHRVCFISAIMEGAERYIARWRSMGLLDEQPAAAIRSYETTQAKRSGQQWQVLAALILGAILLGAGVLLFGAAHWEEASPSAQLAMVLSMPVFFHGLGLLNHKRCSGFATAMHAVGTVSAGAAIALVGQIFNMQENWPAAVLLWRFARRSVGSYCAISFSRR